MGWSQVSCLVGWPKLVRSFFTAASYKSILGLQQNGEGTCGKKVQSSVFTWPNLANMKVTEASAL